MHRIPLLAACGALLATSALAAPLSETVNINAQVHGGLPVENDVSSLSGFATISLDPGDYTASAVAGTFTALSPWSATTGCDGAGENCNQGFLIYYAIYDSDGTQLLRYRNAEGGTAFQTQAQALADAQEDGPQAFTVLTGGTVYIGLPDNPLSDNRGGESLLIEGVSAVPAPGALALLASAVGGFGLLRRRR